jgi:HD-GYP domain-containing protein (c-di-GMP phosphodiesterase class II)
LLPQTNEEEGNRILNRIKEKTEETEIEEIPISISFGLAVKNKMSQDINEILKQADDAMYQNKLLASNSVKNKIIQNLLNTVNVKSSETKEHALRMIELAHTLGESQGLPVSEMDRLSLLAILHDIGKASISKEILTKDGKLTEKEWEIIRNHPEAGSRITSASNEFASVSEEILSHHERWDGLGYPRGLKGESIPFLARIIGIVDAYDVMIHDRPYRKTVSKEEALKEIERCAGTQFDPELAADFIKIMED